MTTTHEVLVAARNLIDRGGWIQGAVLTSDGRCAVGALRDTGGALDTNDEPFWILRRQVGTALSRWNDTPGRTKAEVLAAFDKAIAATAPSPPDLPLPELTETVPVA